MVDFVAASFIRTRSDVVDVKDFIAHNMPKVENEAVSVTRPMVISKIETQEAVDNFDEILMESDGIMIARGDLGVEVSEWKRKSRFVFLFTHT